MRGLLILTPLLLLASCEKASDVHAWSCMQKGESGTVTRVVDTQNMGQMEPLSAAFKMKDGMTRVCNLESNYVSLQPGDVVSIHSGTKLN